MIKVYYDSLNYSFDYIRRYDEHPDAKDFKLHNHAMTSEILFFLKGDCEFRVEGSVYQMQPNDIVIASEFEMHRMKHHSYQQPYDRIVISLKDSFFEKNHCDIFKHIFTSRALGTHNLFSASLVTQNGIDSVFKELEQYISDNDATKELAINSKLIDLLYKLNKLSINTESDQLQNSNIKNILTYINDNITTPLSLEDIASHFYISKYHLCHLFKQHTGLTINNYINRKRLLIAREHVELGKSLTDASFEAGFRNYTSFYKMYVRDYGQSPSKDLKQHR